MTPSFWRGFAQSLWPNSWVRALSLAEIVLLSMAVVAIFTGPSWFTSVALILFWTTFLVEMKLRRHEYRLLREMTPLVFLTDGKIAYAIRPGGGAEFALQVNPNSVKSILAVQAVTFEVRFADEKHVLVLVPVMPPPPPRPKKKEQEENARATEWLRKKGFSWLPEPSYA